MKQYLLFFLLVLSLGISAQPSPVKWSFDVKSTSSENAEFYAKADISDGWNIYSVYMEEGGPIPTAFTFDNIEKGQLEGNVIEKSKKIASFDNLFEMDVIKFKEKAEFTQALSKVQAGLKLKGFVYYMCCDSQRCLPPAKVDFDLKL